MTKIIQFSGVTEDRIVQAYSGRPGCACGCRGKWYQVLAQKKRILTMLRKAADLDADSVEVVTNPDPNGARYIISHETKTRVYVLHVS